MVFRFTLRAALVSIALAAAPATAQELRGHGGPVRALAVSPDGRLAISGSFDATAILWGLDQGVALAVLRFHDNAVNAVAALPDGRFVTAGEDGRLAFWAPGGREPRSSIAAHQGPIAGLAISPDGMTLATASWDGTARIMPLAGGETLIVSGHRGPVNAVAFTPDGAALVSGGHDARVIVTPLMGGQARAVQTLAQINALVVAPDGEIVIAGADGVLHFLGPDGTHRGEMSVSPTPIIALAIARNGTLLAAAGVRGAVTIVERAARRAQATLVGPGLPVWSLAFRPDGRELVTGGGDHLVRRWDVVTGEHIGPVVMARPADALAQFRGDRGAEVFRACVACHTLRPDEGPRAGPTLHGVMGRRIGTAAGYDFSPALRAMDIVWTEETIARLFEIGPNAYTPGTKMPEQIVGDEEDRRALVNFIARASR